MRETFGLIVVGFGPGACAAALHAKTFGIDTLVITGGVGAKDMRFSSESIHPGVISLLKQLNCSEIPEHCIRSKYSGIDVNGEYQPLGEDSEGIWEGMHLDKGSFVKYLQHKVFEAGAEIVHQNAVSLLHVNGRVAGVVTDRDLTYHSDFVIDASGKKQFAARALGLHKAFYSDPLICWSSVALSIPAALHLSLTTAFTTDNGSWLWLAPEKDRKCSWTRVAPKGAEVKAPQIFSNLEHTKFSTAAMRWYLYRPVVSSGLLLCGDAGGLIDPSSGQGIFSALFSAMAAIEAVSDCIKNPTSELFILARYDQWFYDQYVNKAEQLQQYFNSVAAAGKKAGA